MIIEASHCQGLPVIDDGRRPLGSVDLIVFDGSNIRVAGLQLVKPGVLKRFGGLFFTDLIAVDRAGVVAGANKLQKNLAELDAIAKTTGKVIGVTAVTESGESLGRVTDVLFEAETGQIVRFQLHKFLRERLIPRQFLVSMTPRKIIFQDVVNKPIFDKVATTPAPEALTS